MKYRIKNETLKKAIFAFFDEESVMQSIVEQMNDGSNFIQLTNRSASWKNAFLNRELSDICSLETRFYFNKTEIEQIPEYNPNGWNKYPEVKPPKEGRRYLIQLGNGNDEPFFSIRTWEEENPWHGNFVFRELPEPYLGEDLKEEVKAEEIW